MLLKLNIAATLLAPMRVNAPNVAQSEDFEPQEPKTEQQIARNTDNASLKDTITFNEAMEQNVRQDKMNKGQLLRDSLERAIKHNVKYAGLDVRYNTKEGVYEVKSNNFSSLFMEEGTNYNKITERYMAEQANRFSKPTEFVHDSIGMDIVLMEGGCSVANFSYEDNIITMYHVTLDGKDRAVKQLMDFGGIDEHVADSLVTMLYKEMTNPEFVASVQAHEESHRDDFEKNLFVPNLPPQYMARLHMLTEVKASMTQAGMALEQFKQDGSTSHFAPVNLEVDTLSLQKDLARENLTVSPEKHVGQYIFRKWMDSYNVPDSPYSLETANILPNDYSYIEADLIGSYIEDTPESHQEYLRRVDEMFKDVKYLGDMRGVINPEFQLNEQLLQDISSHQDKGFGIITQNSVTNEEAYQRVASLLAVVRDCDIDGVRTPQEQKLINQTIMALRQSQPQNTTVSLAMQSKILENIR